MNRFKDPRFFIIVLLALSLILIPLTVLNKKPAKSGPSVTTAATTRPPIVVEPLLRAEKLVGICLPQENTWNVAGGRLKAELTGLGYRVKLLYGDGTAKKQASQMLELVGLNVDCLVLAPVDSMLLTQATSAALEKNIPILSFGALLMDTEATRGYVCYDYHAMGAQVAQKVAAKLALDTAEAEKRVHTVELFMGSPEDYNAVQFYNGVMSVLDAYREKKVLVIKSSRTTFEDSCILDWDPEIAKDECAKRLKDHYSDSAPDACICASDNIAAGVIAALDDKGKTSLVTGNGNTLTGQENMAAGKQYLTVSTTVEEPAIACGPMIDWIIFGVAPQVNLGEVSNNASSVPTALCGFTLVVKED